MLSGKQGRYSMGPIWSGQLLRPAPSLCHFLQPHTLHRTTPLSGLQAQLLLRFLLMFYWRSVLVCAITRKDKEFEKVIGPNHLLSLEGGLAKSSHCFCRPLLWTHREWDSWFHWLCFKKYFTIWTTKKISEAFNQIHTSTKLNFTAANICNITNALII